MEIPENIRALCKTPASILSQYKSDGIKVIGYTCSNIPEEMIIAAGLQPYRVSNIGANASALTPSFACPFASTVLENILKHEQFFSGFVIAHTCDLMWRLYDILKKKTRKPLFLVRVPHNTNNKLSMEFLRQEFMRFQQFLDEIAETKMENPALFDAITLCNQTRELLKDVYQLNQGNMYKINAFKRFQLLLASLWMPKPKYNSQIKALDFKNSETYPNIRLHVNGTAVYDLSLIKIIEDSGGFIASDDLCTGSRYFWENIKESMDPISALAYRYLERPPCPAQDPLEDRLQFIKYMIREFKAQGVITYATKFCDPILYDAVHIRNMLAKMGIPSLVIEYERPQNEISRIQTRVEAFVESLGD